MPVAVRAASISISLFIQITYSEANLVESLASDFHSQFLSFFPSLSLLSPLIKKAQFYIICSAVTPKWHFRDDFPRMMKQALSGATADYMASCGDQSLCINTFLKKAINAAQRADG